MSTRARETAWIEDAEPPRPWGVGSAAGNDSKSGNRNLKAVVEPARLLLDYAVGHGLVDSPAIIDPIVKIESAIEANAAPDAAALSDFLKSYNALCKLTGGVSAETLSAQARQDQKRTRRIYFLFLTGLLLVAAPLTTISTVGGQLSANVVSQISSTCKDYPVLYCAASSRNESTSYDHYPYAVTDLTNKTNQISQNLWVLAFLDDLFQSQDLHDELTKVSPRYNPNLWSSFLEIFSRSGTNCIMEPCRTTCCR
jgi:hypothetical protein